MSVDYDVRGQQGIYFFRESVILDYGLVLCPEVEVWKLKTS